MIEDVEELYDYGALRGEVEASMFVATVLRPTLVLGGSQSRSVVDPLKLDGTALRRRRGGGGLVLLRPKDLWIDWWIPHGDPRWSGDVHVSSIRAGHWWADELVRFTDETVSVYEGALDGEPAYRVVCFAGRGPGEVFLGERKAVGVTQWRVREGVFLSTVLRAEPTNDVLEYLRDVPEGLDGALDHQALSSLRLGDPAELVARLRAGSGPWRFRPLVFTP